jgi:hypothetical protein
MHFTGPPAAIASIIQAKRLAESSDNPASPNYIGFGTRDHMKRVWDGWQSTTMPNARFFYLHHKSEVTVQGWAEGWWVNGATNEVYAFIGG